jgi:tripartite-type tricarboxylate transporter receptor subunit TctC
VSPVLAAVDEPRDGKALSLYIGVETGSSYASYGRLLAQHLPKYYPGNPTIVTRYMPGAASLVLTNYLYNIAPKDGAAFGLVQQRMGLLPLLDPNGVKYDALKFNWIGSMGTILNVCFVWHTSSIKTIDDAKVREVLVASGSNVAGSDSVYPMILNDVLGTKFKVISGYRGSQEANLALERGEVEGRCGFGWNAVQASTDWIPQKRIHVILQMGMKKAADLANVPLIMDLVSDPKQRSALEFLLGSSVMARPFVAPPGIPAGRLKLLRAAFDGALRDPELRAQGNQQKLDIDPVGGAEMEALLTKLYATPQSIIEPTRAWLK